jgi:hypothetical protein
MLRSYILICSAVALRLISGTAGLLGMPSPEYAYICAAWSSWLLPLATYEIMERWPALRLSQRTFGHTVASAHGVAASLLPCAGAPMNIDHRP